MKESGIKVYETTNYGMFKKMLGNRDVKGESKIVDSIKRVGLVNNPIIVNENYEIIDGQNRLEALRQLNLPVSFIIQKGLGIDACRSLNIGQTNWGTEDYIYSFANVGNLNYKRLASLMNEFQGKFGIQGIIAMAKPCHINEGGGLPNSAIKSGEFELSQEEYELAVIRLNSAIDLGYVDLCKRKKLNARIYWACVSYIYQHQEIEAKKAIESLEQYETLIPSCTRVSEQLQFFDDVINRGTRRAVNKVFLSTDFQKRRYIEKYRDKGHDKEKA